MGEDDGGGVVHEHAAHDLARVDARAVDGAAEEGLEGDDAVAVVEEEGGEDLGAEAAQSGFGVAAGVAGGAEAAVAVQPGLHPAGVDFEEGLDAEQVLAWHLALAQRVAGVVAEPAQSPGGGEGGGVEAHAEQGEELVGGERGEAGAGDAVEAFGLGGVREDMAPAPYTAGSSERTAAHGPGKGVVVRPVMAVSPWVDGTRGGLPQGGWRCGCVERRGSAGGVRAGAEMAGCRNGTEAGRRGSYASPVRFRSPADDRRLGETGIESGALCRIAETRQT